MAVDNFLRWKTIREIIQKKRSGTLIVQLGRCYLHWVLQGGKINCVYSSLPDYSFTKFLLEQKQINREDILLAQSQISEQRSIGAVLLQTGLLEKEQLEELLRLHVRGLAFYLLQPGAHLFWSDRILPIKPQFFSITMSLPEILLSTERSFLEVRSALRFSLEILGPYRIEKLHELEARLQKEERRMLPFLKRGSPVPEILTSPELDRMTCYRTLFLLWLTGYLHPLPPPVVEKKSVARVSLFDYCKGLQADWLLPLVLGILIGLILAPDPDPPEPVVQHQQQSLHEVLRRPAWDVEQ